MPWVEVAVEGGARDSTWLATAEWLAALGPAGFSLLGLLLFTDRDTDTGHIKLLVDAPAPSAAVAVIMRDPETVEYTLTCGPSNGAATGADPSKSAELLIRDVLASEQFGPGRKKVLSFEFMQSWVTRAVLAKSRRTHYT